MAKDPTEWLRQADYDLDTAKDMLDKGRNFYAVFMCHLAVEKALKGLLWKISDEVPPKTHDLIYLSKKIGIQQDEEFKEFLIELTKANIVTEFPEDYEKLLNDFTNPVVLDIIQNSKKAIQWIKLQFIY